MSELTRRTFTLILEKTENIDDILTNLKLLGTLDDDKCSYMTLYKYLGYINQNKLVSLCQYVHLIAVSISYDNVTPEMILFVILRDEQYEISTACIKYCNIALIKEKIHHLHYLIKTRLENGHRELYNRSIRLALWLLQHELISNSELPLQLQELFDVWCKQG